MNTIFKKIACAIGIIAGIAISVFSFVYGAIYTNYFADTGNYFMTAVALTCMIVFFVAGVVLTFLVADEITHY